MKKSFGMIMLPGIAAGPIHLAAVQGKKAPDAGHAWGVITGESKNATQEEVRNDAKIAAKDANAPLPQFPPVTNVTPPICPTRN